MAAACPALGDRAGGPGHGAGWNFCRFAAIQLCSKGARFDGPTWSRPWPAAAVAAERLLADPADCPPAGLANCWPKLRASGAWRPVHGRWCSGPHRLAEQADLAAGIPQPCGCGRPQPVQRQAWKQAMADASSRTLEPLANSSSYEALASRPGGKLRAWAAILRWRQQRDLVMADDPAMPQQFVSTCWPCCATRPWCSRFQPTGSKAGNERLLLASWDSGLARQGAGFRAPVLRHCPRLIRLFEWPAAELAVGSGVAPPGSISCLAGGWPAHWREWSRWQPSLLVLNAAGHGLLALRERGPWPRQYGAKVSSVSLILAARDHSSPPACKVAVEVRR